MIRTLTVYCFIIAAFAALTFQIQEELFIGPTHATIEEPYSNCRILISEIELVASDGKQFIELKKYCSTQPRSHNPITLAPYKIVIVDYKGFMVMICALNGLLKNRPKSTSHRVSHSYFYVVGSSQVENVDFDLRNCQISDEYENSKIPINSKFPFALALIRSASQSTMRLITLDTRTGDSTKFVKKGMHLNLINAVKDNLQDFVLYGHNTPYVSCLSFIELYDKYTASPKLLLRDWNSKSIKSRSINRCGDSVEPFGPATMKISFATPGLENDCENGEEFFIEDKVPALSSILEKDFGFGGQCYTVSQYANEQGSNHPTHKQMDTLYTEDTLGEDEIPVCDFEEIDYEEDDEYYEDVLERDGMQDDPILEHDTDINNYKLYLPNLVNENRNYITESCEYFHNTWIGSLQQDIRIEKVRIPEVCDWFDYFRGTESQATCRFCHALYQADILVERFSSPYSSDFIKTKQWHSSGSRRKADNQDIIHRHLHNPLHSISVDYFQNLDAGLRGVDFENAMLDKNGHFHKFYSATINLVIAVHTAVHMGLPFRGFKEYTDMLKHFGVNLGVYHHNAAGYRKMLHVYSSCLHKELLAHLLSTTPKISLILDESVDVAGYSNYAFVFQTFDDNLRVTTYHYHLSNMIKRNKGIHVFSLFKNQLLADGMDKYFRSNVVGLIADGSKVLQNVFYRKLRRFTKRDFVKVHCGSHRLELAYKASFSKFESIKNIDKVVNSLARFFGSKSSKRKLVLRKKTKSFNMKYFELHRIHPIRWVSSRKRAYVGILSHWKVIVSAIEYISSSPDFKDDHITADYFLDQLKSPKFLTHIAYLIDITEEISKVSLHTQKRNGNFIGFAKVREDMIKNIESFPFEGGKELKNLVERVESSDKVGEPDSDDRFTNLFKFETSINIYFGVTLSTPDPQDDGDNLSRQILSYNLHLISQIRKRFPDSESTNLYEVFNPVHFDKLETGELYYGQRKILAFNAEFKFYADEFALSLDWKVLITSIKEHQGFERYVNKDPVKFWQYFLACADITWTNTMKNIITSVLVVSPSSSEAEREFSIQNAVKTSRRYSLNVDTVDDTIRVKMNSERDLSRVNALTYAREFVRKYRRPDDEHLPKHRPSPSTDEFNSDGQRLKTIFEARYAV